MNPDATSLDRLHDIIAPPPAPWWPPAPAWYWVLGFGLATLIWFSIHAFLRWQHNRYRREALAELANQEAVLGDVSRRATALATCAELLKRASITACPRECTAQLTGSAWYAFLDRTNPASRFAQGTGRMLEDAAYDPRTAASLDEAKAKALTAQVRDWLLHHRVDLMDGEQS